MPIVVRLGLLLVLIDKRGQGGSDGGGERWSLATSWPKNGKKVAKSLEGIVMSPTAITATTRLDSGLKSLASVRGSHWGDGWRCLAGDGQKMVEK